METSNASAPIYTGTATVVKVTPPDYSMLPEGADLSTVKADVTLRSAEFSGEIHFPIDRSRIAEFDEKAATKATVSIRIGSFLALLFLGLGLTACGGRNSIHPASSSSGLSLQINQAVVIAAPDSTASAALFTPSLSATQTTANIIGTPLLISQSPKPSFAWSTNSNAIALQSGASYNSEIVSATQINVQSTSAITATVPEYGISAAIPVYVYRRLTLACLGSGSMSQPNAILSEMQQGGAIVNGLASPQTSLDASDAYISGPSCSGSFKSQESENTLHFPQGATLVSSNLYGIVNLIASQWTNAMTSIPLSTIDGGTTPIDFLFKNAGGSVVAFEISRSGILGNDNKSQYISGPFAESRYAPDGF